MNFWQNLKKPIFALAPMANVTDAAFRRLIAKYGKPDITWTEFVSVEGLLSRGREKLLVDFIYTEGERPIVAQIFGGKPEQFYEVAQLCAELGFDGIDINMGCPDRGIEKSGACAALIKSPELAKQIILETKRGAGALPVSVKTRLGYNKNEIETWIPKLLEAEPAAITLHARTRKEMSLVPARWDQVKRMVEIVAEKISDPRQRPILLGNGDVQSLEQARRLVAEAGCDGAMLGRAIFGNPWLFAEKIPTTEEKLQVCIEHTKLFEELFGVGCSRPSVIASTRSNPPLRIKPFDVMKKHYKAYVNGFDGAKELRAKMMEAENVGEIEKLVNEFLSLCHPGVLIRDPSLPL